MKNNWTELKFELSNLKRRDPNNSIMVKERSTPYKITSQYKILAKYKFSIAFSFIWSYQGNKAKSNIND